MLITKLYLFVEYYICKIVLQYIIHSFRTTPRLVVSIENNVSIYDCDKIFLFIRLSVYWRIFGSANMQL